MRYSTTLSRRSFISRVGATALATPFLAKNWAKAAPSQRLNHASFGASGMAWADLSTLARHPQLEVVAVTEVDLNRLAEFKKTFPNVRVYQDWRRMLDQEKDLDTVNVSTPDHMHAPMGMSAMNRGLHLYGQKPLTHDLYETRRLTEVARDKGLVTQMGIQIHSGSEYRTAVERIQSLTIGKVKEVHTWSGKKWGDLSPKPDQSDPVPEGFDWDLWLGVCAARPFIGRGYYHPGNWRKRIDFGTGTFGDMGCHIYDPVFKALALTAPLSVRSEGPAPNKDNWAIDAIIHYVFPGTPYTAGDDVRVTWYDGDQRPPTSIQELLGNVPMPDQGSIFVGTKANMLLPHIGRPVLLPEEDFDNDRLPRVPGDNHWMQFVSACLGQGKTSAGFDYSGPLTEAVLLGSVATRFPKTTLQWDAKALAFTNQDNATGFVRRSYRSGWEVSGL